MSNTLEQEFSGALMARFENHSMDPEAITTAEQAREEAIDWQAWTAETDTPLYWSDLADWSDYFTELGRKFNLTDEFRENGII